MPNFCDGTAVQNFAYCIQISLEVFTVVAKYVVMAWHVVSLEFFELSWKTKNADN